MSASRHTVTFRVEIDDQPIAEDLAGMIVSAVVDDSLVQPDLFSVTFRDPDRVVVSKTGVQFGSAVTLAIVSNAEPVGRELLRGEVTALEAEVTPGGTFTVIRGYDHSHRLFRGRVTETYRNVTAADVAGRVARRAGLDIGTIVDTDVVYDHVSQHNQSDWEFLTQLAASIGYTVGVVDTALDFAPAPPAAAGPTIGGFDADDPLQLVPGANLLQLRAVVTSAEQASRVSVRGWSPSHKERVVGVADAGTTSASIEVDPAGLAAAFGSTEFVATRTPYRSQDDVDGAARAIGEQLGGAFAELEGICRGNPDVRAGAAVALGLVGPPFDGRYTVTTTRHLYEPTEGYVTMFTVSGRQDRSLLGLASGAPAPRAGRVAGVVPAIVTNVNDPDELGRVKLALPWLADSYETDWARVVQAGAGPQRGAVVVPEVDDEVLAAFDQGDLRSPYVVGGLYNGVDPPQLGDGFVDAAAGAVTRRGFTSKHGHAVVFGDSDADDGISIVTAGGRLIVHLDQQAGKVTIESDGDLHLGAQRAVTIEAGTELALQGGRVSIDSDSDVTASAQLIKLN